MRRSILFLGIALIAVPMFLVLDACGKVHAQEDAVAAGAPSGSQDRSVLRPQPFQRGSSRAISAGGGDRTRDHFRTGCYRHRHAGRLAQRSGGLARFRPRDRDSKRGWAIPFKRASC